jgi:nucleotide-binding universal stress UspA family protein
MTREEKKTIVAAVDTTDVSQAMFKEALVLASSLRARVVMVSVTPEYEGNMNRFFLKDADSKLKEPFEKILGDAADYASSLGLEMKTVRRQGKPSDEIIEVALQEKADLILLGSSKRLQLERMMLGRTIAEIIHDGPCDVLLIPQKSEIRFNKVLVEINDFPSRPEAGIRAFDVAKSYSSEVHAMYVIDIAPDKSLRYGVQREAEKKASAVMKEYVAQGESQGIRVTTEIGRNMPEKCLVEYAQENDIHLIVLSSNEDAGMFEMLWGSVVERVASKAVCPILVAKKKKGEEKSFLSYAL